MSGLRRQGAWAVVDQVLSSGTNFVPALLLARLLGPTSFGAFSLAFLAWFSALALLRCALMQPYTLAAATLEGPAWRDVTSHAAGAIVVAGCGVGGLFGIVAVIVGVSSSLGQAFLALALLAPGLALQEFWRVASFAGRRARTAAANDFVWVICQLLAFAVVLSSGSVGVPGALLAWGAGGWVAAAIGIGQLSVVPRIGRATAQWARTWARTGAWFTADSATFALGSLAIAVAIAAAIGNTDLGLFRGAQTLFGPVQLLTIGAESVFLPHLVRLITRPSTNGVGESRRYSLVMAATVAAYGVAFLLGAETVLTKVFGAEFAAASAVVFPMMIAFTLDAVSSGAILLLRARANGARLVVAQVTATTVRVGAVVVLVNIAGLRGAGWALVIGSSVAVCANWAQVALATRPKRAAAGGHDGLTGPRSADVRSLYAVQATGR